MYDIVIYETVKILKTVFIGWINISACPSYQITNKCYGCVIDGIMSFIYGYSIYSCDCEGRYIYNVKQWEEKHKTTLMELNDFVNADKKKDEKQLVF